MGSTQFHRVTIDDSILLGLTSSLHELRGFLIHLHVNVFESLVFPLLDKLGVQWLHVLRNNPVTHLGNNIIVLTVCLVEHGVNVCQLSCLVCWLCSIERISGQFSTCCLHQCLVTLHTIEPILLLLCHPLHVQVYIIWCDV